MMHSIFNTLLQQRDPVPVDQLDRFNGLHVVTCSGLTRQAAKARCNCHLPPWAIALLLSLTFFVGCGHKGELQRSVSGELPVVPVRTHTVENKKWLSTEEVVGTVRARLHATVESRISGRIAELPLVLGQKVSKGQLLAVLDAAETKARLEQAQAALQQAERDWTRISSLFEQQAVTRSEYDATDARYLVAKAAAAEAQAMVAYVEIRAPFDGVVTRKSAELGDLATPGKPLLDIEEPSALQLEADIPEAIAADIQSGARIALRADMAPGDLYGTVSEIAPAADPTSRTFRVKLDLPADLPLRSGQFARLLVPIGERASLRVPASAVLQRGQMELVFVVENQRVRLHLVKTGRSINGETEILSGLDTGDVVVTGGAAQLMDEQPVTLR